MAYLPDPTTLALIDRLRKTADELRRTTAAARETLQSSLDLLRVSVEPRGWTDRGDDRHTNT